jgi:Fe-S-cluster formation regulator IscX/YfhJ
MFDKKLLLQHIGNRPRSIEEQNQGMGDLHNHLRNEISREYGISASHPRWKNVGSHADIKKYAESVYDQFPSEIDNKHMENSDMAGFSDAWDNMEDYAQESQEQFTDFVHGVHARYNKGR